MSEATTPWWGRKWPTLLEKEQNMSPDEREEINRQAGEEAKLYEPKPSEQGYCNFCNTELVPAFAEMDAYCPNCQKCGKCGGRGIVPIKHLRGTYPFPKYSQPCPECNSDAQHSEGPNDTTHGMPSEEQLRKAEAGKEGLTIGFYGGGRPPNPPGCEPDDGGNNERTCEVCGHVMHPDKEPGTWKCVNCGNHAIDNDRPRTTNIPYSEGITPGDPNTSFVGIQSIEVEPHEDIDLELIRESIAGRRNEDQRIIAKVGVELLAKLLRKNSDYGSSVFSEAVLAPGDDPGKGMRHRMSDKIERIRSLSMKPAEVKEDLAETFGDLAGYCILMVAYLKHVARRFKRSE